MAGPLVFLLAGEPSADTLGARLMAALAEATAGRVRFAGIGGPRMAEQGLRSLFPMDDLAVMGFVEVLPHLPRLFARARQAEAAIRAEMPDLLLTIDSPGFNLRLQGRLKDLPCLKVHYVAPQAWAWRPGRAAALAGSLDHLLLLLPFEPDFFAGHGVACSFVGHPIVEELPSATDGPAFRRAHAIPERAPLLCLLPGSRTGVAGRHLPVLAATLALLKKQIPELHAVLPTVAGIEAPIREAAAAFPVPTTVVVERGLRFDAYAAADLAVAASGTVALELALAGLPMITIYRTGALSGWLARRLIRVPHVNLINLIQGGSVVPELLQADCTPERIAGTAATLLADEATRSRQLAAMAEVTRRLGRGDSVPPSRRAAEVVLRLLRERGGAARA